jgi:hypothetical protein
MSTLTNDLFYSRLPVNEIALGDLLMEDHLFFKVPNNWYIIITDVKKSTEAVSGGLHETINLVATGSIVAVLNLVYKANLTIPFFFGGDGATFMVPPSLLQPVMQALVIHQQNTLNNFDLNLRVGTVPVEQVYKKGHKMVITKLKTSSLFFIPVVLGNGLAYSEKIIKGDDYIPQPILPGNNELDLTGMECRWDRIKPPETYEEVVSLLVIAKDETEQATIFKKVMQHIEAIYGTYEHRAPITINRLKLKGTLGKIALEMRTKLGKYKFFYILKTWITTALGKIYLNTKEGQKYLHRLVDMSDTLIIDGKINTVISGTIRQREQLLLVLDTMEANGEIIYGLYTSSESVMSCYVRNMNDDHIHFVDGSDGGYTRAAGMLKQKLRQLKDTDL